MGIRVIIVGAGIGGLCLAQGLRRDGVPVTVYERDASARFREVGDADRRTRNQGYRIHIDPDGHRGLADCLPPHLYDLHIATCGRPGDRMGAMTDQMVELFTERFPDAEADRVDAHRSVNRQTFREVLLAGLGDTVRFGATCVGYRTMPDGTVRVEFADGGFADGDVLVAADGINSPIRRQYLPRMEIRDLGVRGVYGTVPLTDETRRLVPPELMTGFHWAADADRNGMGFGPLDFREDPRTAFARLAPGESVTAQAPYLMAVYATSRGRVDEDAMAAATPARLWEFVRERTASWHPDLVRTIAAADPESAFYLPIRTSVPIGPWQPSAVTLLGDAIHAMTPAGGVGANTALHDAGLLRPRLLAAHRGERSLLDAVGDYEEAMRQHGFATVEHSLEQAARMFPSDESAA